MGTHTYLKDSFWCACLSVIIQALLCASGVWSKVHRISGKMYRFCWTLVMWRKRRQLYCLYRRVLKMWRNAMYSHFDKHELASDSLHAYTGFRPIGQHYSPFSAAESAPPEQFGHSEFYKIIYFLCLLTLQWWPGSSALELFVLLSSILCWEGALHSVTTGRFPKAHENPPGSSSRVY